MCFLSHWDIVYPVREATLDSAAGTAGSEVNMGVDVLLEMRFMFCTIPSASNGDKLSSYRRAAGVWGHSSLGFFSYRHLPTLFPGGNPSLVVYNDFVNRVASEIGQL